MKRLLLLALGLTVGGCLMPRNTGDYWIVMVDVTPSVELAAETPGDTPTDGAPAPGKIIENELTEARQLSSNDFKPTYYEIKGSMDPPNPLKELPKSVSQLDTQDQQISDYVRYLNDAIDRYGPGMGGGKVRLSLFGDFRHVSGSVNYKNWTPTPKAFGARRMDNWQVELICPGYPSGSGSGVEERANQWKECLEKMGASVTVSTTPRLR